MVVLLRDVLPAFFFVTAIDNATTYVYFDLRRPPSSFHNGLVPPGNLCLLGQDLHGQPTQDLDISLWREMFAIKGK